LPLVPVFFPTAGYFHTIRLLTPKRELGIALYFSSLGTNVLLLTRHLSSEKNKAYPSLPSGNFIFRHSTNAPNLAENVSIICAKPALVFSKFLVGWELFFFGRVVSDITYIFLFLATLHNGKAGGGSIIARLQTPVRIKFRAFIAYYFIRWER